MSAGTPNGAAGDGPRDGGSTPSREAAEGFWTGGVALPAPLPLDDAVVDVRIFCSDNRELWSLAFGPYNQSVEIWTTLAGVESLAAALQDALAKAKA